MVGELSSAGSGASGRWSAWPGRESKALSCWAINPAGKKIRASDSQRSRQPRREIEIMERRSSGPRVNRVRMGVRRSGFWVVIAVSFAVVRSGSNQYYTPLQYKAKTQFLTGTRLGISLE